MVSGTGSRHPTDFGDVLSSLTRSTMPVGLRPEGLSATVGDGPLGADPIERVLARGSVLGLSLLVDDEVVDELGAVVGQDGVDFEREAVEEAGQEPSRGFGRAIGKDFEMDKAGGATDRDIGVAAPAVEWRPVSDIDRDEAGWGIGLEGDGRRLLRDEVGGEAVPLQTVVNAAARQLGVEAAPHCPDDQAFFPFARRDSQPMWAGRTIGDILAASPPRHGAATDTQFAA
jgi:hypothetical protein